MGTVLPVVTHWRECLFLAVVIGIVPLVAQFLPRPRRSWRIVVARTLFFLAAAAWSYVALLGIVLNTRIAVVWPALGAAVLASAPITARAAIRLTRKGAVDGAPM
jgi:hypothetical protein